MNIVKTTFTTTDAFDDGYGESFTVTLWVYRTAALYKGIVSEDVGANRDWFIAGQTNNRVCIRIYNSLGVAFEWSTPVNSVPVNVFNQVGMVVDSEANKVYSVINGVETELGAFVGFLRNLNADFMIGRTLSTTYSFNGIIDEVVVEQVKSAIIAERYETDRDNLITYSAVQGIYTRWDRLKESEVILEGGEKLNADYRVWLENDADVLRNDQLSWQSQRWDVLWVAPERDRDSTHHKCCYVRRLIS
jgi:hypothetical protein